MQIFLNNKKHLSCYYQKFVRENYWFYSNKGPGYRDTKYKNNPGTHESIQNKNSNASKLLFRTSTVFARLLSESFSMSPLQPSLRNKGCFLRCNFSIVYTDCLCQGKFLSTKAILQGKERHILDKLFKLGNCFQQFNTHQYFVEFSWYITNKSWE